MPKHLLWDDKYIPEPNSGCWLWLLSVDADGYGKDKNDRAHRESYRRYKGVIGEFKVLHKCDQPSCINPDHLFLGTHQDNMKDMANKGRAHKMLGDKNPMTKLNTKQVIQIRKLNSLSILEISTMFNVGRTTIVNIRSGKTWNWLVN